ncbi:MAG: helix-turn-helix transcriptional regulator [Clostridia bacterium]|nr:helix-turn-helix transcriptional regulator [Clostridia bacterium]
MEFNIDIREISIAHEFVLDRIQKCEYPSGRGNYGFVYTLEGNAEYRFTNGDSIVVTKGDLLFLSPDAAYTIITEKEFRHYTVNFDIHPSTSELDALDQPYLLATDDSTERLKYLTEKVVSLWTSKRAGCEMQAIGRLYELLSVFYYDCVIDVNMHSNGRLLCAKEYIERHFTSSVSLAELARLSNMSVTHFRREWKKHYNNTPLAYRDAMRLSFARELISSGYYTVSEIAEKCGFEDVGYFIRFFKKHTGITPFKYKQQLF